MQQWDARRAEELASLKLALATFALQLDAFEARLKRRQVRGSAQPSLLPDGRLSKLDTPTSSSDDMELIP